MVIEYKVMDGTVEGEKPKPQISRRDFLKIGGAAIAAGLLARLGYKGYIEYEGKEKEKFLETNFWDLIQRSSSQDLQENIFKIIPHNGNIKRDVIGVSERLAEGFSAGTSVVIQNRSELSSDSSLHNLDGILQDAGWPGFASIPMVESVSEGSGFKFVYNLVLDDKKSLKVRDVLPLSLMQAGVGVYRAGESENEYFQNEILKGNFATSPNIVVISGLSVLFLGEEDMGFFNLSNVFAHAFNEWVVQGRDGSKSVEISNSSDILVDLAERMAIDMELTYAQMVEYYKLADISTLTQRLLIKRNVDLGKRYQANPQIEKAAVGISFLNFSSFIEEYVLQSHAYGSMEEAYKEFMDYFANNMIPNLDNQRKLPAGMDEIAYFIKRRRGEFSSWSKPIGAKVA
jgi:hypothetical protein